MNKEFGQLGNLEIYFAFRETQNTFQNFQKELNFLKPKAICKNNWDKGISEKISYNDFLNNISLTDDEEIVIDYEIENNYITCIFLNQSLVISIRVKPWVSLKKELSGLFDILLKKCYVLLAGYELDFDYYNIDRSLVEMQKDKSNYPFFLKYGENGQYIEFCDTKITGNQKEFQLLKNTLSVLPIELS